MTEPSNDTAAEFPRSIGKPATRALANAGITSFEELTTHSAKELLALHGVGPKSVRMLGEVLAGRGMAFAKD